MDPVLERFKIGAPALRIVSWSRLGYFGTLPIVKATVLFPVIGYMLVLSDSFVDALNLQSYYSVISVQSKLRFVYFGLFSIAAFSVAFSLMCPAVIKRYLQGLDYARNKNEEVTDFEYSLIENSMIHKYGKVVDAFGGFSNWQEKQRIILRVYHEDLSNSAEKRRLFCSFLLIIGLALLSVPSVIVFLKVLEVTMSAIASSIS